jgi:hypothetical protein
VEAMMFRFWCGVSTLCLQAIWRCRPGTLADRIVNCVHLFVLARMRAHVFRGARKVGRRP